MLRRLAANAGGRPRMPLLQSDATRLPAGAGTFGSVLAVHVLHLIGNGTEGPNAEAPGEPGAPGPRPQADATWAAALREAARRHGL
jgi:hypothetical protein